jgi:hypothetical protein
MIDRSHPTPRHHSAKEGNLRHFPRNVPEIFGLTFKRTTGTSVDIKNKVQHLCAIMKAYDHDN